MNIAMLQSTPYPPEEGIGNYVANLSQELTDRGHSVHVITRGGIRREQLRDDGLRVAYLPCPPLYPFHVDMHGVVVDRYIKRRVDDFDLVHAHTPLTPAIRTPLPLVSTVHTSVVEDVAHVDRSTLARLKSKAMLELSSKRLVTRQTDAADRVTTTSERVRRELTEHYGIDGAAVLGNAVDVKQFYPGGPADDGYVLYVGRLDHPKGLPDLLEVAERVLTEHDIEFTITGKGPMREDLERQARRLGIEDDVTFTGYVSRTRQRRLYQNATAFVLPSHYEGLPTVLLEAMACATPAVATTVGGCPEVIDDGQNGLLVPPGDHAALFDAIDTLLRDREMRERLSENARETVLDRYNWKRVADDFEREYRLASEGR